MTGEGCKSKDLTSIQSDRSESSKGGRGVLDAIKQRRLRKMGWETVSNAAVRLRGKRIVI